MSLHQITTLPDAFRRVRLTLAREHAYPEGEAGIGYTLLAPLTADGHLDVDLARRFRSECKVIRFRPGEEVQLGYLRQRPGGSWTFHYDEPDGDEDDDPAYRLGEHRFIAGEYVTVFEDAGAHTYRVASVETP